MLQIHIYIQVECDHVVLIVWEQLQFSVCTDPNRIKHQPLGDRVCRKL